MQGMNSVAKAFDKQKDGFLLLMDKEKVTEIFDKELLFKDKFVISQKFINKEFMSALSKIKIDQFIKEQYIIDDQYFYVSSDIKDFQGNKIGIVISGRPLSIINESLEKTNTLIYLALIVLIIAIAINLIASLANLKQNVLGPIRSLKRSIDIIKTQNVLEPIGSENDDEIGDVVQSFNEYLGSIEQGVKVDRIAIDEVKSLIN